MCKLSIKFTRKIAGVSTQSGVSHPELIIQVRDDQTHCPNGRNGTREAESPEVTQVTSVKSNKSESSSLDAASHAAGRNHTAGFLSWLYHGTWTFPKLIFFLLLYTLFYGRHLLIGHTPNFKFYCWDLLHESVKVMKLSPLMLTGFHTADSPLCSMMEGLCSCSCRVTGWEKAHSDQMLLVNVPSQSPFPCLLFLLWLPGTPGEGRTCNSNMPLLLWPRDERGWCWVTAGNNFLCWDIVFGARVLDWPRGWNSSSFSWRRWCFKCTKGSSVSVSEAAVCQQYKRYCSCCLPWNKSTYGNHRMWFKKKEGGVQIANGKWQNPSHTFSSCKT